MAEADRDTRLPASHLCKNLRADLLCAMQEGRGGRMPAGQSQQQQQLDAATASASDVGAHVHISNFCNRFVHAHISVYSFLVYDHLHEAACKRAPSARALQTGY